MSARVMPTSAISMSSSGLIPRFCCDMSQSLEYLQYIGSAITTTTCTAAGASCCCMLYAISSAQLCPARSAR